MADRIDANELLGADFGTLLPRSGLTEAELLDWLTARVAVLLTDRRDYLMSLCYTLDLDEAAVAAALAGASADGPAAALARLLYNRQCARLRTKRAHSPTPLTDADAW